jgi:uncharacterized protein YbjT (DUF2867 family)
MFAITGSTGEIGRRVAVRLARLGVGQRLIVGDPDRAPQLPGAEIFPASSYSDAKAMGRALNGVETLFLVSARDRMGIIQQSMERGVPVPPYDRVQEHVAAIAAAAAVGVRRIVYLSFLAPSEDATFILARDHFHTEEYLRSVGVAFTFLRQSLYMDKVAQHIARSDVIRAPAGDGRVAWVCRDDVADVAVAVLIGSGHEGLAYDVTGPEALTMAETAERLSAACGRKITYEAQSPHEVRVLRNTSRLDEFEAKRIALTGRGITGYEVDVWISHYLQIATGEASAKSDTVLRLCGHPATTLADYLAREGVG